MLALSITDSEIHAVLARGTVKKGHIKKTAKSTLESGAVVRGIVQNTEQVVAALKKLKKDVGGGSAILCLPPEHVYYSTVTLSPEDGSSFHERLESAIEREIPEKRAELQYHVQQQRSTKEGPQVSIIAVRKDILRSWQDACKQAGFPLRCVTSLPLCVSGKKSCALVTSKSSFNPTITVMQKGWPIDEAVLSEKTSDSALADELTVLLDELQPHHPVDEIIVIGPAELVKKIQAMFTSKGKKGEETKPSTTVPVRKILPWIKGKEMGALGAIAASLHGTTKPNLLRVQRRRTTTIVLLFIFVVAVCSAVVAYLRPDLIALLPPFKM